MSQGQNAELNFKPVGPKLKGVGGWLTFFIVGHLVLRPLKTLSELTDPKNAVTPLLEANFPTAAAIIGVVRALSIGMAAFGVVVALTLWKVHAPSSVKLAKVYLILNPILYILSTVVFKFSDLPPQAQDEILRRGLIEAGAVTLVCLIWFLYFTKSVRVRNTYFNEVASLGLR